VYCKNLKCLLHVCPDKKKIHWGNVACIKIATRCILSINIYTSPAYVCVYSKLINKREREREKRTLRMIRSTHQSIVKTVNDSIVILWKIILSREKERCAYFSCLSFKWLVAVSVTCDCQSSPFWSSRKNIMGLQNLVNVVYCDISVPPICSSRHHWFLYCLS